MRHTVLSFMHAHIYEHKEKGERTYQKEKKKKTERGKRNFRVLICTGNFIEGKCR